MGTTPTPRVLLDDGSGTFPYDITTKVKALDGYEVTRGREDWIGAVTAGQLSLTLNNSDGRFTPGSTILGTPSPITVDQRIRLSESVGVSGFGVGGFGVGGFGDTGWVNRFTGYVKAWPVSWPAVVTSFSEVQITATDAQARAERRTLRAMPQEQILASGVVAYHPLSEAEGAKSAADLTGKQTPLLPMYGNVAGASYAFGTDLGLPDGSTGLTFTEGPNPGGPNGQGYRFSRGGVLVAGSPTWTSSTVFINFVYMQTGSGGASSGATAFAGVDVISGSATTAVSVSPAGQASWNGCLSSTTLADGKPHVISAQAGGGLTTDLWVAGVKVATAAPIAVTWANSTAFVTGQQDGNLVTTFGHFAYGPRVSDAQVLAVHQGLMSVFAGDTADQRIARLATYAGIPTGTLETSVTATPVQETAGVSAWDAIQEVTDAELGLTFVDGSGALAFHNRNHVVVKTAPDLILDAQYLTTDVEPVHDDQQIINYIEATAAGTGGLSVARNLASETTHGRYPVSESYLVQTDAEALDRANWIVAKQAEPFTRYGTLTINLYKMSTTQVAMVLASLDLNCWLRVTSLASQNPGGTVADVVVQGWSASVAAEGWSITCNVVARSLYQAFVIDVSLLDDTTAPIYV